jgi:hypothetical protein
LGEVLRAILDQNCVWSKPAFYSLPIITVTTVTGAVTFGRRQVSIPCKTDCWFLVQAWAQVSYNFSPGGAGTDPKAEASTFSVQRTGNQEAFAISPQIKSNQNYNLNNLATLDEYVLFAPGELITLIEDVQITNTATVHSYSTFVVLTGVEYKMPAGKGGLRYGQ